MLFRILLLLLFPLFAFAQDCDCCTMRDEGHTRFNAGNYKGAKSAWQKAKKIPDAAKCTDLDTLIAEAQAKIILPKPKKLLSEEPAPKKTAVETTPVSQPLNKSPIASPVAHRKKSGLTMIPVEGDTYTMGGTGSNECPHEVRVSNFSIGQYEVTQADWQEVMGSNPSNFKDCAECPVEQVSWDDIQNFITKANQKYGRRFRLSTEAEWEFAARGGKKSQGFRYAGTDTVAELYLYANFCDSKCTYYGWADKNQTDGFENTSPVGSLRPNELDLFDMSGNVWEWCEDTWGPYPGCLNPNETDAARRVLRGGSWLNSSVNCHVAIRDRFFTTGMGNVSGFRLAQD